MADDQALDLDALGRPLDREPVEPVAADAEALADAPRQRVGRRDLRDRRVEGRVEDGDVRGVRQELSRLGDRLQGGRVVKRRELDELLQACRDVVIDQRRLAELRPAVDDPMCDSGDIAGRFSERRDALGRAVRRDERELQARRARVDDEDRVAQ